MRRIQLGLFERGDDLPLMLAPKPESPPANLPMEIEPAPTYVVQEAHWSGRGRDGFAVVEIKGERKRKLGTFPTRRSAEWLLRQVSS